METSMFFVGNYNIGTESKGIYSVVLDETTGKMKVINTCDQCENPSYLAVNKQILYVANELGDKAYLTAYHIHQDGKLDLFDKIVVHGAGVCYIALWKDNAYISGACYTTGSIFTCSLHDDGSFKEVIESHQNVGKSVNEVRQESSHMHSITPDVNSKYWIAADLGADDIFYYQADNKTGKFELIEKIKTEPGEGPRHFVFDKTSTYGYLVTELQSNIYVYKREEHKLIQIQKCSAFLKNDESEENYAAHIEISNSGEYLYVSNRGADTIDVFNIENDGRLTAYSSSTSYGHYPRHFEISPSGKFMIIAHQKSHEIVCCKLLENGEIGECVDKVNIPKAINICFTK